MSTSVENETLELRRLTGEPAGVALPVIVSNRKVSLLDWLANSVPDLERIVQHESAVLLRGFTALDPYGLQQVADSFGGGMQYLSGVSPRTKLRGDVYTSTDASAETAIPLHNELSYGRSWPGLLFFSCARPASAGGQTPIADSRSVYLSLDDEIRHAFEAEGISYVANYWDGGPAGSRAWQEAFETNDREVAERFCASSGMEWEWWGPEGDRLRTRHRRAASRKHPATGERVWFNQANVFHSSNLDRIERRGILARHGIEALPRNALYGNGDPIPQQAIDEIKRAYDEHTLLFDWQEGDLLILDNMRFAHGRMPFSGARQVLVAMARPHEEAG